MNKYFRPKHIIAALWIVYTAQLPVAMAADMTATVPAGSGFVVKNADGTLERLRVQETGVVTIPSLSGATPNTTLTCFDGPTGRLGPCAIGVGQGYAYAYNTSAQVVAIEADVVFDTNGVMSGITHAPNTTQFSVDTAGVYAITWVISGVEPNQFALFVNGAPNAIYGSGAGTQQNNGQAMVQLAAGDVITLRNHSSAAAVTLQTLAGGTQVNVNASIMIRK